MRSQNRKLIDVSSCRHNKFHGFAKGPGKLLRINLLIIFWLCLSVSTNFGRIPSTSTSFGSSLAWFDTDDASSLPLKVSRGTEWNAKRVNSRNLVQASPEPAEPTYLANAINDLALPSFDAEYMPV